MVFPPSLPPSPPPSDSDKDNTRRVQAFFFLAVVGMFLLHILGPLRRRLSHGLLHHIVMGVYTLSYPLVGYTVGLMQSSDWYYNDFPVWAVFLLLFLSSTDSLTACRLNDIDNWKSIYVKQLFKGFLLVSIVVKFGHDMEKQVNTNYLWYPLSAILFVIVLKSYVMIASMRMVSVSCLGKNVKVIAEYMQYIDNKLVAFDPVTMKGYRYMVAGEKHCVNRPGRTPWYKKPDDLKVTTAEQIWQCKGNLLINDQGKVLKDVCLSLALSKMLNRRFAGFKLSESELEKTHDFVFKGLLVGEKQPHQRAFRVIEEELVFVHDMYYTRYSYLYQKGRYLALCLPLIMNMIALCSWLTVTCLLVNSHDHRNNLDDSDNDRDLQNCTLFVTVVLALLEAYQMYLYMASGWFKKNGHLTNGVTSLQKNAVRGVSWACDATATDGAVTRTILIWHIATTLCEHQLDKQAKEEHAVKTASTLSKYCMHLLAFAPNLLPDHSTISESILDQSIDEAGELLKEAMDKKIKGKNKKAERRCEILMEIGITHDCVGDETKLVAQGIHLARHLIENIEDSTLRWKVLSDFWVEMMLYVSPSDDARAHLEFLIRGGEFITHLWALLTHAGVLKRGPTEPKDVV
ncbi:unnamed protein product [Urochloa decumbens]|uniref:DUF4220 domain-containing protein n=1 Tax=Urochloa decumbens TaxID=240449 RepID=A0ABC9ANP2_9POAL